MINLQHSTIIAVYFIFQHDCRMKRSIFIVLLIAFSSSVNAQDLPSKKKILAPMRLANDYFMKKWSDPGKPIVTNKERPSNILTRGVYYEGLMALYSIDKQKKYYNYAVDWSEKHKWGMRSGTNTRNADDQTCGQTYIDLYLIDNKPERIKDIKTSIDTIYNHGGKGLYNPADHLWWRDKDFVPPYKEPNGEDCYWSRGNG